MDGQREPLATMEFGRFKVVPDRREVLVDGTPIALGGRAFDVLILLIKARGTVIDKDELMRRVWPDRVVDESNLQAQIAALREAFGGDRNVIRTVAGRGYLTLHRPSAIGLLDRGVVRPVGDRERAFELDAQRSVDRSPSVGLNGPLRRIA